MDFPLQGEIGHIPPAAWELPLEQASHEFGNIAVSDGSTAILGNVVAQTVNLNFNGQAQVELLSLIRRTMMEYASVNRQSRIAKGGKRPGRSKNVATKRRHGNLSNTSSGTVEDVESSNVSPTQRPLSMAERVFTRELLIRSGVWQANSVHRIDDLPYMKIALRMARGVDAYFAKWLMVMGDEDIYANGGAGLLLRPLFESGMDISIIERDNLKQSDRELSIFTLMVLFNFLGHTAPNYIASAIKMGELVLRSNHPVTFICATWLEGQGFTQWRDIVFLHIFDSISRLMVKNGPDRRDGGAVASAYEARILNFMFSAGSPPGYSRFENPECEMSCARQASALCESIYGRHSYANYSLKLTHATLLLHSNDEMEGFRICEELLRELSGHDEDWELVIRYSAMVVLADKCAIKDRTLEAVRFYRQSLELALSREIYVRKILKSLRDFVSACGDSHGLEELLMEYSYYFTLSLAGKIVVRKSDYLRWVPFDQHYSSSPASSPEFELYLSDSDDETELSHSEEIS